MSDTRFDAVPIDNGDGSASVVSSRLMIAAIAFFFAVVIFVALLDLFARRHWSPGAANSRHVRHRTRSRLVFHADHDDASAPRTGLPTEVLEALPIRIHRSSDFKEATDCAVCLSELADGDKVRLLPPCQHCFHVDCIDMWFHSHSTCPLCRNGVTATSRDVYSSSTDGTTVPPAPTTANERALVIEIPRRALDAFTSGASSPLPTSRRVEDTKSPAAASATPSRLRPLRRILSREKRTIAVPSCSSPGGGSVGDLEMGVTGRSTAGAGGSGGLKTPRNRL